MNAEHIADVVLPAGAALSGLLLIFVGNALSGFEGYEATERAAVRGRYMWRGWLGFAAYASAMVSTLAALVFYWDRSELTVTISMIFLALSLVLGLVAGFITALDIR